MAAGNGSGTFGASGASGAPTMTPAAWLAFLEPLLDEQAACVQIFQDYYDGKHRLQMATAKFREAFSRYFPPMANNWMQTVVDLPASRLTIQGFRINAKEGKPKVGPVRPTGLLDVNGNPIPPAGGQVPSWELDDDSDAWSIWQANNLDSTSRMLHTDAIKLGVSYVLVAPADPDLPSGDEPLITPEHASQCYVYCSPVNRSHRLAGIKRWIDDVDGFAYCNIYLPDEVHQWRSADPMKDRPTKKIQWTRIGGMSNPMGLVPLVPLENKPDLLYGGRSDLEQAIPIQDAINKYCLDMQVSSEYHAYPQRYATGWERAKDRSGRDISGREVEIYLAATRMIRTESKEAKFGQFEQGNVENYLRPIEMWVDHLAAQTQTPLYYLKGKMSTMSADAMHAQDQGLVDRCQNKILSFSDGWEEVMRLAFLAKGDKKRGTAQDAEVVWADVESKSLAVLVQAAMVMRNELSVPIEMCWEMLGWSPQKIRLARDLMGLPPGGAVSVADIDPALGGGANMTGPPGAPEPNSPSQHPGNQPGLPSGQAANKGNAGNQLSTRLSTSKANLTG